MYFGGSILGYRRRFRSGTRAAPDGEIRRAQHIISTALKMMMKAVPRPRELFDVRLHHERGRGGRLRLGTGSARRHHQRDVRADRITSSATWPARAGSIGRPIPGTASSTTPATRSPGEVGEVAVEQLDVHGDRDADVFLGYWKKTTPRPPASSPGVVRRRRYSRARRRPLPLVPGRADDLQERGLSHRTVRNENCCSRQWRSRGRRLADPDRGTVVKAFIVLSVRGALEAEIQAHVRSTLPYEYPKEIEFIDQLPMTTTGKSSAASCGCRRRRGRRR